MAVLLQEFWFGAATPAAGFGRGWSVLSEAGGPSVAGGGLLTLGSGVGGTAVLNDFAFADGVVDWSAVLGPQTDGGGGLSSELLFRYQNPGNYYQLDVGYGGPAGDPAVSVILFRLTDYGLVAVGQAATGQSVPAGEPIRVRLTMAGPRYRVEIGAFVVTFDDSTILAAGRVGFRNGSAGRGRRAVGPLVVSDGLPEVPTGGSTTAASSTLGALMAWMAGQLRAEPAFGRQIGDAPAVVVGRRGNVGPVQAPRAWIYPVGFRDANDSPQSSTRTIQVAVALMVPEDPDDASAAYARLDELGDAVTARLEGGPAGVIGELGGLLQGSFDAPLGVASGVDRSPVGATALTLLFAYASLRDR